MWMRFGLVRLVAVIGMLCLVCQIGAGTATAQTIGAGSCQTSDGSSPCAPDLNLNAVGAGSCDGFAAPCSSDPALTTVGDNACNNGDASDPFSNCSNDLLLTSVGDDACDEETSCDNAAALVSVGTGSCNSLLDACGDASSVGDGSCNTADPSTVCGSVGPVGDNACDGHQACDGVQGVVGDGSCDGFAPCGGSGGVSGSVGASSCDGSSACDGVGNVGGSACNGSGACDGVGSAGGDPGDVGDYSCNGGFACDSLAEDVGVCQDNTIPIPQCDPVATPALESGTPQPAWNAAEVTVDWNWATGPDGAPLTAASATNCPASSTTSGQGPITLSATCTDGNGNVGTASDTFNVDTAGPADAPVVSGTVGTNGWYTSPVSIAWNWADALSGLVATACTQTSGSGAQEGAGIIVSSTCEDTAGGTASVQQSVNVDSIAPSIAFSGNTSPYGLLQTVDIHCTATDNAGGSGVASSPCSRPLANRAAWTFGLGWHTLSATATDNAGNTTSPAATTTFRVTVLPAQLCTLTTRFVSAATAPSAAGRAAAASLVKALCIVLGQLSPTPSGPQAAALIHSYDAGVGGLHRRGLLTSTRVTTLRTLAAAL